MAGKKIGELTPLGRNLISTDELELSLTGSAGSRKITGAQIMAASGGVPYTGATQSVNLGANNLSANNLFDGFTSVVASGTLITLTLASTPSYLVTGSGGQTIKLPDATTLPKGAVYNFNNNQSSGTISVNNNSNTLVKSVPSGGNMILELLDNATAAGSWDTHFQAPSNVSWSTNTLDYVGSITGATWNGVAIADAKIASAATWNAKQAALVSGTNIKTVNGSDLLGSGNLSLPVRPYTPYITPGFSYTNTLTGGGLAGGFAQTINKEGSLTPFTPLTTFTVNSFSVLAASYTDLVGGVIGIYQNPSGQQIGGTVSKVHQVILNLTAAASIYTVSSSFTFTAGITYWIGYFVYTVPSSLGATLYVSDPRTMLPISSPVSLTQNIGYVINSASISSTLPNLFDLSTFSQSSLKQFQVWFNVVSIP